MRILAVDLGLQRTGVAISDEREILASPIGTVTEHNRDRLLDKVAALAAEGESRVFEIGHIDRGYASIEADLTALGAQIIRVKQE